VLGNTVVVKPATDTPLSVVNLLKVLEEAGLPRGVVNMVTGGGGSVGSPLMHHKDVGIVSFTGSTDVGRKVSEACAPAFKHCHLEMGGKNVIMVMDDARLDLAVDGAVWGGFGTTGQRCTAASRVVVHKKVYREFIEAFAARARALRVGNGYRDDRVEMGPCVNAGQLETVERYVAIGKGEGARLLCGGSRLASGDHARGYFHEPTIFGDCSPQMRVAREEIFGPVVAVIPVDSLEQAIEVGNSVDYGLSASIYTQDINKAFTAMRDMYTGIFYVNAPTIGAETHLPFGGTKNTGNGHREACVQALEVFCEWKSIYIDYSGTLQRAQIDA
jgi:aldehyde dehydrogenase (NAD+)